ncbi:unnamed protein product [Dibothriocephalus latus]|uniref:Uncharacterized protein n=1 Tax=Dibothriocephalus latus TaxID=60516 RepID=A0A3P7N9P5_DIBLA|nr:unnamed protein product [Dibothriocephalus latus]
MMPRDPRVSLLIGTATSWPTGSVSLRSELSSNDLNSSPPSFHTAAKNSSNRPPSSASLAGYWPVL